MFTYREPTHLPGVRCDSGIEEGSEISIFYDPMICKLVCHGKDRKEAISRSVAALDQYIIRGVTHNIPLLRDILTEKKFNEGNTLLNFYSLRIDYLKNKEKSRNNSSYQEVKLLQTMLHYIILYLRTQPLVFVAKLQILTHFEFSHGPPFFS